METKEEQLDKNNTVTWYGIPFFPCVLFKPCHDSGG